MKVLLINGSRRENGCTYTALSVISKVLKENGIETEFMFIGEDAINGKMDELLNKAKESVKECDGIIVGSPVYYASPSGEIIAFLDRLFTICARDLKYKPAAAICSARRAGTTATLDVLNKYFTINQMPLVSSSYWNMVHGNTPEDVMKDDEGIQVMEQIGSNMAWLLKCIEAGKSAGIPLPAHQKKVITNFIR